MILSRSLILLLLTCAACANARTSQSSTPSPTPPPTPSPAPASAEPAIGTSIGTPTRPVFRDPFTLTLDVGRKDNFEQKFEPIPYTHQGVVYLFKGDHFGVKLDARGVATYEPDLAKADLEVEFSQGTNPGEPSSMMLVITSHLDRMVSMNALMTVPDDEYIQETSIRTVQAGLKSYESWPHPIKQLVLKDFRLES